MSRRIAITGLAVVVLLVLAVLQGRPRPGGPASGAPAARAGEPTTGLDALRWQRLIAQDEHGVVPDGALLRALEVRAALADRGARPAAAGVGRGSWEWVGPTNYAGRMRTILPHPIRTTHLLAGSAGGGIWKSENAGQTWRPTDDFLGSMAIQSLVLHPADPERVYAGTGESLSGVGVLRSTDFGETWQQIAGTETMGGGGTRRLAFSSHGLLYAATPTGVYRVSDDAPPVRLVHASSWDVQVSPANPSALLAVLSPLGGQAGTTVIARSLDAGATWTPSGGFGVPLPYVEIAFARSNPQIVYALSGHDGGKLYRSLDGGATFALIFEGIAGNGIGLVLAQPWRNMALWVNPFDPNSLMAGGVALWKSTNGGSSWVGQGCPECYVFDPVIQTYNNLASGGPVDFQQVVSHPAFDNTTNRSVYVVFDQGALRVSDIGQPSATVLNPSLGTMQFYAATGDVPSGRLLTGSQDTGVHVMGPTLPGPAKIISAGDGGPGAFDPTNPDRVYLSTQYLDVARRTLTPPVEYSPLTRCDQLPPLELPDACTRSANFIAPFVMDPHEPARLYAGGLRLWRTTNAGDPVAAGTGPAWSDLNLPDATAANFISAIAVSPRQPDTVWVARNSGAIFRTANATAAQPTWTRVGLGALPGRYVTNVTIWPHDDVTVYVTFGGSSPGTQNVWRSLDGGGSWHSASGFAAAALPAVPVREVLTHPSVQGGHWLYAATDVGLFTSEDGGNSWAVPSDGSSNAAVFDMFWMGQTLYLATHGRSLWRATIADPSPAPCAFVLTPERTSAASTGQQRPLAVTQLFPGAGSCAWTVTSTGPWASVAPASGIGSGVTQLTIAQNPGAARTAEISIGQRRASVGQDAGNPGAPGAPAQLQAQVSGSSLVLTWTAGVGALATNHLIEAGTSAGQANIGAFHTGSASTSFGIANVPAGTYFVRVRAVNAVATSGPSNGVQFTVAGCFPTAPAGFQATASGLRVTFSWTSAPGITYLLQAGSTSGSSNLGTFPVGPGPSFSVAAPPGTYFVRLLAQNGCGTSPPSADVAVTVTPPSAPGAPGPIAVSVAPDRTVMLTWSPPSSGGAATGYVLDAGSAPGASNLAVVPLGPTPTISATVLPGVYYVRVRAVNGAGSGPPSPEAVVTVP